MNIKYIVVQGVDVDSAWITGPDSKSTLSGTSMAAPHVVSCIALSLLYQACMHLHILLMQAGVMAKVLSDSDKELAPKELENILVNQ